MREDAGAFDVSHMGELEVEGPKAPELLQGLLSNDLDRIEPGGAQYTLLTNERGGIIDDLIAYELEPYRYLLIVNASNREADYTWLKEREVLGVGRARRLRRVRPDRRPGAARARAPRAAEGARVHLRRGRGGRRHLHGQPHGLHRRGGRRAAGDGGRGRRALGRDRSSAASRPAASARATRSGSRSATRCTGTTSGRTPTRSPRASAGSARSTRTSPASRRCAGSRQRARPTRLVAFVMEERAIPRQGMKILEGGEVTSGTHSPMLDQGIGMGYVPAALDRAGHRADDRRARQAAQGARRQEADLPTRGVTRVGRELPRRPSLPPRARLGAHRRRHRHDGHHLVRPGRARRARPLRAAGRRRDDHEGRRLRRGRVGEGRLRPDRAAVRRGARGEPESRRRARDGERRPVRRRVAREDPRQRPERGRRADGRRRRTSPTSQTL